jgi:dienelactone hydrolase
LNPFRLDSMADRWAQLRPHVQVVGPDGRRPGVLIFHGCGGIWGQLDDYAQATAEIGGRAIVVDSYAPRGWGRTFGMATVCTGALLRGAERAGDVLAAAWGASNDLDVDPSRLVLAGWSHGAWSIMDLMTMPLERPGEAGLADGAAEAIHGVRGLYLAYPYGGIGALSRTREWVRAPRALGVIALKDHITNVHDAERLYEAARRAGAELDLWRVPGHHCFDEPDTPLSRVHYDPALAAEALDRFKALLEDAFATPA